MYDNFHLELVEEPVIPDYYFDPAFTSLCMALDKFCDFGDSPYEIASWAWYRAERNNCHVDDIWDDLGELVDDYYYELDMLDMLGSEDMTNCH